MYLPLPSLSVDRSDAERLEASVHIISDGVVVPDDCRELPLAGSRRDEALDCLSEDGELALA